ncbi:hypothetical protein HUT18_08985 [Streptomyces sp. NA04227]|uniref:hypothetical protein n=1 Tax=Streptomyces sp. NA04227 TaxID=2742136 RepID=UPI001592990D|nr:hypothetical protein [Streptomyces sp. NA04227]QKW06518.1 hypothetical protein HUT18_08985 [Streptomyces sp. NA04227]
MKYVTYLCGAFSALYAGYYLVLYLYRWEWQRALIAGVVLLAVEGFLVCLVLLSRLSRLENRLAAHDARVEEVRRRLEQSRHSAPGSFRWMRSEDLDGTQRTFVFIPVLMVAGAALSGVAFVVQKIAAATARPAAERRLAGRLAALTAPGDLAAGTASQPARLEDRSPVAPSHAGRNLALLATAAVAVVLLTVLRGGLADATQTRPQERPDAAATTVVFRIEMRGAEPPEALQLAAEDLWQTCRRSTAALNDRAFVQHLEKNVYAGVIRPALPPHDLMRLRGCIEDATTNRATARVLGEGQAGARR